MTDSANSNRLPHQAHTLLLATDSKNSVLVEVAGGKLNPIAYSAYGKQSAQQVIASQLGFNGELRESLGWYLLGKGYRAFNPTLMRFHSPDSWSPFGKGGLNAYMYCVGDPVNASDPTGHIKTFFTKLISPRNTRLTSASSTSSLNPLIQVADQSGEINTGLIHNVAPPRYENISSIAGQTHNKIAIQNPIVSRLKTDVPPPVPPKQKPHFNDAGGEVGVISPNWKPGEPERFRKFWKSEPYQHPIAPVPPIRTLSASVTRQYSVSYDALGNPHQRSVQMADLSKLPTSTRNTHIRR